MLVGDEVGFHRIECSETAASTNLTLDPHDMRTFSVAESQLTYFVLTGQRHASDLARPKHASYEMQTTQGQ